MEIPPLPQNKVSLPDFLLCVFSLTMLLLSTMLGTVAIVAFLLPWVLLSLRQLSRSANLLLKNWVLLLIPVVAGMSAVWSHEMTWTVKASAELGVTVIAGILAAELVAPAVFISALMTSLLTISAVCVLVGIRDGMIGLGGGMALQGIYESKNAFSSVVALLMLVCVSVATNKGQAKLFRFFGVIGVLVTPILLFLGQSVGTIFAVFMTIAVFWFIKFMSRQNQTLRSMTFMMIGGIALGIAMVVAFTDSNPLSLLEYLGKDSTLTGRTFLWSNAADIIANQPILGFGYRAFWRVGNPLAEQLWYASHVDIGSGFNFHNEYLEIMVELGLFGLTFMLIFFGAVIRRVSAASLQAITPEQSFAAMLFIMFMLRTPVEVGVFDQFGLQAFLLGIIWIYLRPPAPPKDAAPLYGPGSFSNALKMEEKPAAPTLAGFIKGKRP